MLAARMKLVSVIAVIFSLVFPELAGAAPRVGLVRIKEIYAGLPSTGELSKQVQAERTEIGKNQRAVDLRRSLTELQELQTSLADKKNQVDEETLKKLARSYELKLQETRALQQEFEGFRDEEEKRIARKEVAAMRASLNRIMETAHRIAKERGYDLVFEDSGNSNTGLPVILYSKMPTNLTADVQAALQDADKTATQPADKPTPQQTKP